MLVLRDRDTVARLAAQLQQARRVALVGNGGIALELVHALRGVEARSATAGGQFCMRCHKGQQCCVTSSHEARAHFVRKSACMNHELACVLNVLSSIHT